MSTHWDKIGSSLCSIALGLINRDQVSSRSFTNSGIAGPQAENLRPLSTDLEEAGTKARPTASLVRIAYLGSMCAVAFAEEGSAQAPAMRATLRAP